MVASEASVRVAPQELAGCCSRDSQSLTLLPDLVGPEMPCRCPSATPTSTPVTSPSTRIGPCSIASGEWIWVGGFATANAKGVYGTQGAAAAMNVPGARENESYWTDTSGNLRLFRGYGYDSAASLGELNDVWKYSPTTGMWTWVGGPDTAGGSAVYGTLGVAAAANIPGAREEVAFGPRVTEMSGCSDEKGRAVSGGAQPRHFGGETRISMSGAGIGTQR